jgi:hypothetical protein
VVIAGPINFNASVIVGRYISRSALVSWRAVVKIIFLVLHL